MRTTNINESNGRNSNVIGYVATGIVTIAGIFLIYEMFANGNLRLEAQWNMFKSFLCFPLYLVGLVIAIMRMGKSHYSYDVYEQKYDGNGNKVGRARKSQDVTDVVEGNIFAPLIGHFVLEPFLYAAVIYYPLMGVVALIGAFVPYILTAIIIALCAFVYKFPSIYKFRYQTAALVVLAIVLTSIFTVSGFAIENNAPKQPTPIQGPSTAGNGSAEGKNDWTTFDLGSGVKHCVVSTDNNESATTYDFNENGALTQYCGQALEEEGSMHDVKRDGTHRIVQYTIGDFDCVDTYTIVFDESGKVLKSTAEAPDGNSTTTYEYDGKGHISKQTCVGSYTEMGDETSGDTKYHIVTEYTYQTFDGHGNWTKRSYKDSDGNSGIEKRTITYYN